MSRLYASIDSDARKTQATSRGYKDISAHVRGWDFGIEVDAYVDSNNHEVMRVFTTGGSNDSGRGETVAVFVDGFRVE